ncbi:hypothetical protein [Micromonospora sp. NPDC005710]|uniref:hypothetical protein n=1 Tax=Micromonospora sp. NPDC005710 TaxID=3157051 RepID=UPI0033C4748B
MSPTGSAHVVTAAPPRWAVWAAYAVPLCVLPSALWRLSLVFTENAVTRWYMIFLSAVSMGLALATLGLVHRWGQRLPHRVPRMGGRRIPARPVVRVALVGGWTLVAIGVYFLVNQRFHLVHSGWVGIGDDEPVHPAPGWEVLRYYAPMLAWGPLVIAVAADYGRRAVMSR